MEKRMIDRMEDKILEIEETIKDLIDLD